MANGTPAPKKPAARRKPAAGRVLPALSVAHFAEAMRLVEELVEENEDVFIAAAQRHREKHRAGTERRLTAAEAAQIAAAMSSAEGLPPVTLAVAVQESELRGYEEPDPREILLSAGIATAPAFMQAVQRIVALVELPVADLEAARETDLLDEVLDTAVKAMEYEPLDGMRDRARRALEHFGDAAAGAGSGKALGLLSRALLQAMAQAMTRLGYQSTSSSLTGSPPSTTGPAETSSTEPATSTP